MLDKLKISITTDCETLLQVTRTSLCTKLSFGNGDILADVRNYFIFIKHIICFD